MQGEKVEGKKKGRNEGIMVREKVRVEKKEDRRENK